MKYVRNCINLIRIITPFILIALLLTSCGETSLKFKELPILPINESEIDDFQSAYAISFNEIANAIESDSYYELKAKEHIDKFYNFDEGEVMIKIGNQDNQAFRYTYEGMLAYLIGKNKQFPEDIGIAKEKWRKTEWNNMGTIMERDIAIVIGRLTIEIDENQTLDQNYVMALKRNKDGKIKLVAHKVSNPC